MNGLKVDIGKRIPGSLPLWPVNVQVSENTFWGLTYVRGVAGERDELGRVQAYHYEWEGERLGSDPSMWGPEIFWMVSRMQERRALDRRIDAAYQRMDDEDMARRQAELDLKWENM